MRITDARGWSEPELEMWCHEQRPAISATSWLVIDRLDCLSTPGVVSLPRLERISGRAVVASTRNLREHATAAALVTTIHVDELGHRSLTVDRPGQPVAPDRVIGLSIHASTLRVRDDRSPRPGPGQLRLGEFGPRGPCGG